MSTTLATDNSTAVGEASGPIASGPVASAPSAADNAAPRRLDAHVVLLSNFVTPNFRPVYEALARRARRLTILLSTPMEGDRQWKPEWGSLDVRVQRTWTFKRPRRHPLGFKDFMYVHVPVDTAKQLRELKPDVIFSGEFGFRSLLSWYHARWVRRTPLVLQGGLSEHSEKGKGRLRHWFRRWLLRRPDAVLINGPSGARYLRAMGVPDDKIFRVNYACQQGFFDRCPVDRPAESAHRLLYVGRLIDVKGILPFLTALAAWARRHPERRVEFDLAGSGCLRDKIAAFDVPSNVTLRLHGECDFKRLAELYAAAGIFAFPSLSDDWGIAVNEAMTSGLPVLGSVYSQAVEEFCADGKMGWSFHPDKPAEMESAIEAALGASVDELHAMRIESRSRIQPFNPETAADQMVRCAEAAMARHGGQRSSHAPA